MERMAYISPTCQAHQKAGCAYLSGLTPSPALIMQLFAGKKGLLGSYSTSSSQTHALECLAFADLESLTLLTKALCSLSANELYTLFQASPLPELMQTLLHQAKDKDQRVELVLDLVAILPA
jgi:hypothetical protein